MKKDKKTFSILNLFCVFWIGLIIGAIIHHYILQLRIDLSLLWAAAGALGTIFLGVVSLLQNRSIAKNNEKYLNDSIKLEKDRDERAEKSTYPRFKIDIKVSGKDCLSINITNNSSELLRSIKMICLNYNSNDVLDKCKTYHPLELKEGTSLSFNVEETMDDYIVNNELHVYFKFSFVNSTNEVFNADYYLKIHSSEIEKLAWIDVYNIKPIDCIKIP